MTRPSLNRNGGGAYFANPSTDLEFVSSGAGLLDCILGGGWPLGRVANIVGDKSTGKTLLAIEAFANFHRRYHSGAMFYNEAESAFDKAYAKALGLPAEDVEFCSGGDTVEEFHDDLEKVLKSLGKKQPAIYVLDSLDALSDKAEKERKISDSSYSMTKAKQMSQLFRRIVRSLTDHRCLLIIISQVRDNIGVSFGAKYARTGGRALDFYASQVLYLAQKGVLRKTVNKVERAVGIQVRAKCTKNKIGLPLRECDFEIKFGYGVDDVAASVNWLETVGRLDAVGLNSAKLPGYLRRVADMSVTDAMAERAQLDDIVRREWSKIETGFLPKRGKYA